MLSDFAVPYIPMKIHMNFLLYSTMQLLIFIGVGIFQKICGRHIGPGYTFETETERDRATDPVVPVYWLSFHLFQGVK